MGHKILGPHDVDTILAHLDGTNSNEPNPSSDSPFHVFHVDGVQAQSPASDDVQTNQHSHGPFTKGLMQDANSTFAPHPDMCEDDTYLFNHYTTHVADWMLPCESHNKPWKSLCPAVGCEYPFLLQSLLSYAALNLANLDSSNHDLLVVAREKYALAVAGLRHALSSGTHVSYSVILTTILKLCMSEVGLRSVLHVSLL